MSVSKQQKYRLVFRGEIADGQHQSVVKKKLAVGLKLPTAKVDQLFSGKPVVLKKEADAKQAAALQALFKKAGARLRVAPIGEPAAKEKDPPQPPPQPSSADDQPQTTATSEQIALAHNAKDLKLYPAGANLLDPSERPEELTSDVATDHIAMVDESPTSKKAVFLLPDDDETDAGREDEPVKVEAADDAAFSLAEPGATMGSDTDANSALPQMPDVDFDVADVGVALLDSAEEIMPEIDIESLDFDLAEVGAYIGQPQEQQVEVELPDTSHLSLVEEPEEAEDEAPDN